MLQHQLRRLEACPAIDDIVVATTDLPEDDVLARFVVEAGHRVHRGDAADVLGRMLGAATSASANVVVRATGDCPLLDPSITAQVVDALVKGAGAFDYASNVVRRTFPRGMDVEAFSLDALTRMDELATSPEEREHVTIVLRTTHPEEFRITSVEDPIDNSDIRLTVDEQADLELLEILFERLGLADRIAPYQEIVAEVRAHPDLLDVNRGVATWSPGAPA